MTQPPQPPQPPNEPPQGGFGAPQNPPPGGGFGGPPQAPGTPPPAQPPGPPPGQPAYGYPQPPGAPQGTPPPAPGTPPPGQPGGYGYPAPGQQPQQPQYGYPQPQYPQGHVTQPMGAPGGGKKANPQLMIIVAAVVAVALIVGGGVWFASSGDEDPKSEAKSSSGGTEGKGGEGGGGPAGGGGDEAVPSDTNAQVRFQLPAPKIEGDRTLSVKGSWLTDDVYVKSGDSKLVGYGVKDGKELWTLPVSGPTCAGSRQVSEDGLAAVVFEAAGKKEYNGCSEVAVFDTKTGDKVWQKNVADGDEKADFQEVILSGDTVAAGGGTDGGAAWELKSGKPRWAPKSGDTCKDAGYAGGEQLVAVRKCGSYDNPRVEVQLIDPVSGTPKWTYKLPNGIDNAKVMSTKPVVFGVDSGGITSSGVTDIFAMDDAGKLRSKAVLKDGDYQLDCDVTLVQECTAVAVGNDRVYVPTAQHQGGSSSGMTNEIIAFDLATGKTVGPKADAGERYEMLPLRMDGNNILAYKIPPYDKGGQVVTIDPKTMKQTVLLENPAQEDIRDAETQFSLPDAAEMLYGKGGLYISDELMSKPSASDTRKRNLAVVFGTR
ncbi:outer membrane protein assembly factor BamB family protein [Streptomyces boluensis]|uniref:PQQ-binding-like beta-propeller repeat protein n=1 Tax=Streptomyces boluensis TaxID=1775135 RepID=A0A964UTX7_9ACTN|nr:PQQ-binding-like beta-propeller repeat protein [Streptomyces boluensis]NBE54421.1 PQQ-binding-like beta-propeller repeat protein [Streptomyces boluensis]